MATTVYHVRGHGLEFRTRELSVVERFGRGDPVEVRR